MRSGRTRWSLRMRTSMASGSALALGVGVMWGAAKVGIRRRTDKISRGRRDGSERMKAPGIRRRRIWRWPGDEPADEAKVTPIMVRIQRKSELATGGAES